MTPRFSPDIFALRGVALCKKILNRKNLKTQKFLKTLRKSLMKKQLLNPLIHPIRNLRSRRVKCFPLKRKKTGVMDGFYFSFYF